MTIQRLYSMILDAVHVTEAEVRDRYRFEQGKINLELHQAADQRSIQKSNSTEEDIKKYYERNKESSKSR